MDFSGVSGFLDLWRIFLTSFQDLFQLFSNFDGILRDLGKDLGNPGSFEIFKGFCSASEDLKEFLEGFC